MCRNDLQGKVCHSFPFMGNDKTSLGLSTYRMPLATDRKIPPTSFDEYSLKLPPICRGTGVGLP
jgi:hypothetical protein